MFQLVHMQPRLCRACSTQTQKHLDPALLTHVSSCTEKVNMEMKLP